MVLRESYIANWKNLPKDAIKVRVARPSIFAPSEKLLEAYKAGEIDWNGYRMRFLSEIEERPGTMNELRVLAEKSKKEDIYLICYEKNPPCHRFILLRMAEVHFGAEVEV